MEDKDGREEHTRLPRMEPAAVSQLVSLDRVLSYFPTTYRT